MKIVLKQVVAGFTTLGVLSAAAPAAAQMASGGARAPGAYLGAGAGVADFEDNVEFQDLGDVELDDDSTAYKFFGGYRATEFFGVEGGYRTFGEADAGPFTVETDGLDVSAVGFLPIGPMDLFAKGGMILWNTDVSGGLPGDDGEDLTYGVGGQLNVGSLFFRLESEWFELDFPEDTQMISGSVGWSF